MATNRCELALSGPVSLSLLEVIRSRFDHVSTAGSTLTCENVDQASVRALMNLLWDAGHEVLSLSTG